MNPFNFFLVSVFLLSSCTVSENTFPSPVPANQTEQSTTSPDVSVTEQILKDAYREELLAETLYTEIVQQYPTLSSIESIVNSEEKHSAQVGKLLDARGIARPTDFGVYDATYKTLSQLIRTSLTGAIEA